MFYHHLFASCIGFFCYLFSPNNIFLEHRPKQLVTPTSRLFHIMQDSGCVKVNTGEYIVTFEDFSTPVKSRNVKVVATNVQNLISCHVGESELFLL